MHYGGPRREEREKGPEKIPDKIIAEKFLNLGKKIFNQAQEVQRVPGRLNPKRNTLRNLVIKLTKIKDKTLKAIREKDNIQENSHSFIS